MRLLQDHNPEHRVCSCGLHPVPGQEASLVRGPDGRYGFANLIRCGSVWVCPICRSHIARTRGAEVEEALTKANDLGLRAYLLTVTARHTPEDPLDPLWCSVRSAVSGMFAGRAGATFRESFGYVGRITAFEVTYGPTGWHPHAHLLVFAEGELDPDAAWKAWQRAALKEELTVTRSAFDVQLVGSGGMDADTVSAYLSKAQTASWTVSDEMTSGDTGKVAAADRATPFALLDAVEDGDADAAEAFVEYVTASRGVSSLRWSPRLRERLGIVPSELSDEEAANESENDTEVVRVFTRSEWTAIVLGGHRVALLEAADSGIPGAVERVVRSACSTFYARRRPMVA